MLRWEGLTGAPGSKSRGPGGRAEGREASRAQRVGLSESFGFGCSVSLLLQSLTHTPGAFSKMDQSPLACGAGGGLVAE